MQIKKLNHRIKPWAGLSGFTLIELLVVIAIIALLLSITVPALKKVKEQGKMIVCLAHGKGLTSSWMVYAENYEGALVFARPMTLSLNPNGYYLPPLPPQKNNKYDHVVGSKSWVGIEITTPRKDAPEVEKSACITEGALFPYASSKGVYWCPTGQKGEQRTFSIVDIMNGVPINNADVYKKMASIKSPSQRFVFIDEGVASPGSWTIHWNKVKWWDKPRNRHSGGDNFSFADGHSENYHYKDKRTIEYIDGKIENEASALDNEDFDFLQRGCWGEQVVR